MTVTDYLGHCAWGKEITQVDGLEEVLAELKAQGRNLNQLTMLANMGRIDFVDGKAILSAYASLYESLLALTSGVA